MSPKKNPNEKSGCGCLMALLLIVGASWLFWPSGPQPSPSGGTQAPPPPPVPSTVGPMKFDWPRGGADGKTELAANLRMVNYYVVLDGSGSMSDRECAGGATKMEAAKSALAEFAKSVPASAQLGLAAFDGAGTSERVPLGTGNRDHFLSAVRAVSANGGTPLRSSIGLGIEKLEEAARRQLGYGDYNLVIVTDGAASPGEDPGGVVAEVLGRSPVIIHTIGFCIGKDHSLNQPGRTLYRAADNPAELRAGLGEVLAESPKFDVSGFSALKGSAAQE